MAEGSRPQLRSFVEVAPGSHFPIQNLPFGVFRRRGSPEPPRPAVAIGDFALDLAAVSDAGLFHGPLLSASPCFRQETLNMFLGMGRPAWKEARATLQKILSADEPVLRDNEALKKKCLVPMSDTEMLLPIMVGDYTDFFCSVHHARNCGFIFRGPQTPVNPNWFQLPIGYHGRASSVIVSGTDIIRPKGQGHPTGDSRPYFGPSKKLDFELEMAAIVGPGNELGKPIDINDAEEHIFGLMIMNDWSARDIQAWETIPLGPFLGKSFSTTVSPWIVTMDALKPFTCEAPKQEPEPLPYLAEKNHVNYDIPLEVWIKPKEQSEPSMVAKSNFKHLYWTLTQQLAHHTVNGCNLRPGDMFATGTLSGPEPESLGCLLELTWNGQKEISVGNSTRKFLEDGDEVILTACCKGEGYNVGFGTCTGKVLPALP
uniref:Fumarylacetoacetase n=1 Tax=Oryza meridionalis TaxID=40149 RepID=A0A0E0CHA5_9ORYZ